jgi:hypothetical protein
LLSLVLAIRSSSSVISLEPTSLDRLHLLVEIVLALRLLHLPLDAAADALFHLQHADLAFHQAENLLEALGDRNGREQVFLLVDLDDEMAGNGIGQLGMIFDLANRSNHFGGNLLVELHIALEFRSGRARQRLHFGGVVGGLFKHARFGLEVIDGLQIAIDGSAAQALHQHLDGAVGQLEQLQHGGDGAGCINLVRRRIVILRILLGHNKNMLVVAHDFLKRFHRLFTADKERHDHAGKHDDVAQRKHWINPIAAGVVAAGIEFRHL